ncbi:NAC domain-containing protein 29 [Rhynchospora pubera]|uniref:NAC domain-containing protein 29 n=1 Tax=Rhynchospora pubera TaxID=906938 RepID=A0AAV8HET2_9POAL|nr:NAC domain-containing protein 29 [Rhynchospora pubera]
MERSSSTVVRLPPGFRFHPTDEELVAQYLKRKVFSYPVPAGIIPEIDFLRHNPADLPGGSEGERYFFNQREAKYRNGSRSNRATRSGSGYWKASGKDKPIIGSRSNQIIGFKKTLVFYQGKPPRGTRTDWIMHEYRLANDSMAMLTNWVLCRIFKKKRNSRVDMEFMDHAEIERPGTPPPLSESSCVTENSDDNGKEVSSQ